MNASASTKTTSESFPFYQRYPGMLLSYVLLHVLLALLSCQIHELTNSHPSHHLYPTQTLLSQSRGEQIGLDFVHLRFIPFM